MHTICRQREREEKERRRRDEEEFSFSTVTKECTKRETDFFLKNTTPERQEQEEVQEEGTDIKTTSRIVYLVSAQRTRVRTMQRNNTHLHSIHKNGTAHSFQSGSFSML